MEVLGEEHMMALGMGALLGVGQGNTIFYLATLTYHINKIQGVRTSHSLW